VFISSLLAGTKILVQQTGYVEVCGGVPASPVTNGDGYSMFTCSLGINPMGYSSKLGNFSLDPLSTVLRIAE